MKKYFLFIILIFLLSSCGLKNSQDFKNENKKAAKYMEINNQEIKVEIADTPAARYRGLSFRESLCENCGMLFVFDSRENRTFVMRNMNFPLDIIWIDGNPLVIVKIDKNLPPEGAKPQNTYTSGEAVDYVLEVKGGFTEKYGIKTGDRVICSFK